MSVLYVRGKDGVFRPVPTIGGGGGSGGSGEDGATFTPAVSLEGVISWTNDKGLDNPESVDLVSAVLSALPDNRGVAY